MGTLTGRFSARYHDEAGYRQLFVLAIPLIFSSGAVAVQQFVDRMFLAWHSPEAIAATMPAGMVFWTIMSLFTGTTGYISTFVAQYWGAGQERQIGSVIWQGMHIAVIAGLVCLIFVPFSADFFRIIGHPATIQEMETTYFRLLCFGAGPATASAAISGFFTGRGKTVPVMWVNIFGTGLNMLLNYVLIFGKWGLPAWGVFGAGLATLIATCSTLLVLLVMLLHPAHERRFATLSGWRPNLPLLSRLIRYALPNGIQFTIEQIGFTVFILLVGRLGMVELAATNIAFNINMLAFMPMMGFGTAISVVVGQNLGKDRPDLAERSVYSGLHLTFIYFVAMSILYVFTPYIFVWPFAAGAEPGSLVEIEKMVTILLRFIAIYMLFDALSITFSSGIKGAGDTRFVMFMIVGFAIFGLTLPLYIALVIFKMGLYTAWGIITVYIILLGFIFMFRFHGGKWKSMRVIEQATDRSP
ncbi:MAG: MATE family efflux transporter [Desulfobacterales bacterium]